MIRRDPECDLCKAVLTTAFVTLAAEPTQDQLSAALRAVCATSVLVQLTQCVAFLDRYEENLPEAIQSERDVGLLCALLGVCQ